LNPKVQSGSEPENLREHLSTMAVPGLRWALGIVVLLESIHFAQSAAAARHFAQTGLPAWIRPALVWSEAGIALLFLVPVAMIVSGSALLLIFAIALAIHFQARDFGFGGLIAYRRLIICITHREKLYEHQ
jgi:hypothetical protein